MDRIKQHWKNKPFKGWRIVGLIVIVCLLSPRYYVWTMLGHTNAQTASSHFDAATQSDVAQLQKQFEVYADTLYSGRALFLADSSVSRQDWTNFVDAQDLKQRYPGVNGISYVRVIKRSQAAMLTEQLNANRLPSEKTPISIYPASKNGSLAVLTYLAPENIPQSPIGFDLFTSPARKQALDAARDMGEPHASVPLSLVNEEKSAPPSLLIAMPVYNPAGTLATVAERRAALEGYVTLSLRSQPLLNAIFKAPTPYGNIAIAASADNTVLYQTATKPAVTSLHKAVTIELAGQPWQLDFSASKDFGLGATSRLAPSLVFWSIIPFALILFLAFYFAINLRILRQHHTDHHHGELEYKDD